MILTCSNPNAAPPGVAEDPADGPVGVVPDAAEPAEVAAELAVEPDGDVEFDVLDVHPTISVETMTTADAQRI
jgi:hypothetical protein